MLQMIYHNNLYQYLKYYSFLISTYIYRLKTLDIDISNLHL